MSILLELTMPTDSKRTATRFTIDPGTLTPKARALAEAIADPNRLGTSIHLISRVLMRDLYKPGTAEEFFGANYPGLNQPARDGFDGWWKIEPTQEKLHEILEWEARKFPRYYPVAADWSDLRSSAAARDDDGLTREQALEILRQVRLDVPIDVDTWMRKATKGLDDYPAPLFHNGYRSLWSEAAVRAFADRHTRVPA